MTDINLKELNKKIPSEELAKLLAEEINIITLKRALQIAEYLHEERKEIMRKVVDGLERIKESD